VSLPLPLDLPLFAIQARHPFVDLSVPNLEISTLGVLTMEVGVATLHIEHSITDLDTWLGAFGRFEEARAKAGVRNQRVHQPVDDDKYIYITLDFDRVEDAEAFKNFLETKVWASAEASPALGSAPKARVLAEVDTGS
jgi:hypothetical protein